MAEKQAILEIGGLTKVKDFRSVMQQIAIYLQSQYIKAFEDQGRGGLWYRRKVPNVVGIISDLKSGGAIKARRFQERPVLIDTGRLRMSGGTRIVGDKIFWGTNVPYAPIHQWGGNTVVDNPIPDMLEDKKIKKGLAELKRKGFERASWTIARKKQFKLKIPARPFLEVLPEDIKIFKDIIHKGLGL